MKYVFQRYFFKTQDIVPPGTKNHKILYVFRYPPKLVFLDTDCKIDQITPRKYPRHPSIQPPISTFYIQHSPPIPPLTLLKTTLHPFSQPFPTRNPSLLPSLPISTPPNQSAIRNRLHNFPTQITHQNTQNPTLHSLFLPYTLSNPWNSHIPLPKNFPSNPIAKPYPTLFIGGVL